VNLFKAFFNSPITDSEQMKAMDDPTLYKVVTSTDSYCGRVSYQDTTIMWMKVGDKPVKILKANIVRINIL
jgi:hypothetical protein